jgi:hypothetical protein
MEIWKDIPNYEGIYQVSNLGNVKSLKRYKLIRGKFYYEVKERVLKISTNRDGYCIVHLHKNSIGSVKKIHQLVAMAFLNHKPCGYKIVVDHIDNNKLNNRLENLQLITQRENVTKNTINKSGITGVIWIESRKKWKSYIYINKKLKHLGYFNSKQDANSAYQNKLKEIILKK